MAATTTTGIKFFSGGGGPVENYTGRDILVCGMGASLIHGPDNLRRSLASGSWPALVTSALGLAHAKAQRLTTSLRIGL